MTPPKSLAGLRSKTSHPVDAEPPGWPLTTFPQPFLLIPKAKINRLTSLGFTHSPTSRTHAGSMKTTCANPQCGNRFEPKQRKHIYCSERCRWAVANTRSPVRREKHVPVALRDRPRPSSGASGPISTPRALDDCPAEACNRTSTACNTTRPRVGSTPALSDALKGTQRKSPPPRSGSLPDYLL
jgi:hypothetical protein